MEIKKVLNDFVLIKLYEGYDFIKLKDGKKLWIDTSVEVEWHRQIKGEVIKVPKLNNLEIKENDIVLTYFQAIGNAFSYGFTIIEYKKIYAFVHYPSLIARFDENKIYPLNGRIIGEPLYNENTDMISKLKKSNLIVPDQIKHSKDSQYAKIISLGYGNEDLKINDIIFLRKNSDIDLEYDLHKSTDKKLIRFDRDDVLCIIENSKF